MRKKKFIWLLVTCLMVVSLLVTSCGGAVTDEEEDINGEEEDINGEEEDINGEEEDGVTNGKDMVVNSAGKLVERPRYGGTHVVTGSDPQGFDELTTPSYSLYVPMINCCKVTGPGGHREPVKLHGSSRVRFS